MFRSSYKKRVVWAFILGLFISPFQIYASDYKKIIEKEDNLESITRVNSYSTDMITLKEKKKSPIDNLSLKMNWKDSEGSIHSTIVSASILAENICCYLDQKDLATFALLNTTANKIAGFAQSIKENNILEINAVLEKLRCYLGIYKNKRRSFSRLKNELKEEPLRRHLPLLRFTQSLALHDCSLKEESTKIISKYCLNLKKVDFSNKGDIPKKWNAIGDDGLRHLSTIDTLENVNASGNKISNIGIKLIASEKNLFRKKLRTLNLSHNEKIDDEGVCYLSNLNNLEDINLSYTNTRQKGAEIIAKMKNIKTVNLDHTLISKDGVLTLINRTNITDLYLSSCCLLSKEIMEAMKNATHLKKIRISPLNMNGNHDNNKFLKSL